MRIRRTLRLVLSPTPHHVLHEGSEVPSVTELGGRTAALESPDTLSAETQISAQTPGGDGAGVASPDI